MFGLLGNLYFYLNRHHTTALASNFKGKMHSKQNIFAKCMTKMFALNCGFLGGSCQGFRESSV